MQMIFVKKTVLVHCSVFFYQYVHINLEITLLPFTASWDKNEMIMFRDKKVKAQGHT